MSTSSREPGPSAPPVLLDVLEEHLEELDFLIEQRESSLYAPDLFPFHLERLEERIEAHLDGLHEGQDSSRELARAALESDSWSLVAAGALVLLRDESGDLEPILETLLAPDATESDEPLDEDERPARMGLAVALRHTELPRWEALASRVDDASSETTAGALADALAFHRRTPPQRFLEVLRASEDPWAHECLWDVRRRVGPAPDLREVEDSLAAGSPRVRHAALVAAARWSLPGLVDALRGCAARSGPTDSEAIAMLGALGTADDRALLESALPKPEVNQAALRALGALGERAFVPRLIDLMSDDRLAHTAADAFLAIIGEPVAWLEDPPDPETEMPDADEARVLWEEFQREGRAPGRLRGGHLVDDLPLEDALVELDLEGAQHAWLRSCVVSAGKGPDHELEAPSKRRRRPHPEEGQAFSG